MNASTSGGKSRVQLIANGIEEFEAKPFLDEYVYESIDSLTKRFDVSKTTILKLIREHKPQRFRIRTKAIRFRVMDIVRLVEGVPPTNRSN